MLTGILAMSPDYLQYRVQLLNPDALGNPLEHFGDEETGEEHSDNVNPGDICVFKKVQLNSLITLDVFKLV